MGGNKLRKDQVQNLPEDLTSLESEIESTDSVNDLVDESLNEKIDMTDYENDQVDSSLQTQITNLGNALLSILFPQTIYIAVDGTAIVSYAPEQFPIPAQIIYTWYYNEEPDASFTEPRIFPSNPGTYRLSVTFITSIGTRTVNSDTVSFESSR